MADHPTQIIVSNCEYRSGSVTSLLISLFMCIVSNLYVDSHTARLPTQFYFQVCQEGEDERRGAA